MPSEMKEKDGSDQTELCNREFLGQVLRVKSVGREEMQGKIPLQIPIERGNESLERNQLEKIQKHCIYKRTNF